MYLSVQSIFGQAPLPVGSLLRTDAAASSEGEGRQRSPWAKPVGASRTYVCTRVGSVVAPLKPVCI